MSKIAYNYIQIFAVVALMGYWFTNSFATYIFGDTSLAVSVVYWAVLLAMSILSMHICRRDIRIRDNSFLKYYAIIMLAYTIRMFIDMIIGPFVGIVPIRMFYTDILLTGCGVFTTTFALISCRHYLNIDRISQLVYWVGLLIILIIPYITELDVENMQDSEERMDAGRGMGSLTLVKIGVIEVIVAIHLLLNQKQKYLYIPGLVLAIWTALASGSRGGVIALIIALFYFLIVCYRKNIFMLFSVIIGAYAFAVNIIPLLEWLSQYFPVIGQRMIEMIVENDQSGRELLRERAYQLIYQNPILGYSYRLSPSETGYSCHNGVLDIFLAFGVPFGLFVLYMVYFKSIVMSTKLIMHKKYFMPVVMALWVVIASMSASGITDATFCFSICLLGTVYYRERHNLIK